MNPWLALVVVLAACWQAWTLLAARSPDLVATMPLLLIGAVLLAPWFRHAPRRLSPWPLSGLLMSYAIATLTLPPLLRILPASLAVAYCLHAAAHPPHERPSAAFVGLVALALPVVDSLEFFLAWPARFLALQASLGLLRMNGVAVETEGLALRFGDELVEFDAPCSGVRMLWACWFLASALAYLYRLRAGRYALALLAGTAIALASNVLRATSLFYLETGLPETLRFEWLHDAIGVAAFCITAVALCTWISWSNRTRAT